MYQKRFLKKLYYSEKLSVTKIPLAILKRLNYLNQIQFSVECFDGHCVNDKDEQVLDSTFNITGEHTKEECLKACEGKRAESGHMTACQWKGKHDCLFHTKPIAKGSGNKNHQCCVFNKG